MESAENIIVLRSVYGKVNMKYYINPCKDPKTGRFPDCVRTVDSFGNMILSDKDKNNNEIQNNNTFYNSAFSFVPVITSTKI